LNGVELSGKCRPTDQRRRQPTDLLAQPVAVPRAPPAHLVFSRGVAASAHSLHSASWLVLVLGYRTNDLPEDRRRILGLLSRRLAAAALVVPGVFPRIAVASSAR
jgi:hypothetical protein